MTRYEPCIIWKLDLLQTRFKLLGINFNVYLEEIVGHNYNEKPEIMEKMNIVY